MQRRGVLLLTSIVVMVVVGAGVALAANISCPSGGGKCLGDPNQTLTGSQWRRQNNRCRGEATT